MNHEPYLMPTYYRAHPWHGIHIGQDTPHMVSAYIEIVPTDTVKYELDKSTGLLKVDRPQKYSNYCPALYGLIPQTYCSKHVADYCSKMTGIKDVEGDSDPLDICVLAERPILRADILLRAIPIGGFRTMDKGEADDKIIAVLEGDLVYGKLEDVSQVPPHLIDRLRHYFLTYKDCPSLAEKAHLQNLKTYGRDEAHEVIRAAELDYKENFEKIYSGFQALRNH